MSISPTQGSFVQPVIHPEEQSSKPDSPPEGYIHPLQRLLGGSQQSKTVEKEQEAAKPPVNTTLDLDAVLFEPSSEPSFLGLHEQQHRAVTFPPAASATPKESNDEPSVASVETEIGIHEPVASVRQPSRSRQTSISRTNLVSFDQVESAANSLSAEIDAVEEQLQNAEDPGEQEDLRRELANTTREQRLLLWKAADARWPGSYVVSSERGQAASNQPSIVQRALQSMEHAASTFASSQADVNERAEKHAIIDVAVQAILDYLIPSRPTPQWPTVIDYTQPPPPPPYGGLFGNIGETIVLY